MKSRILRWLGLPLLVFGGPASGAADFSRMDPFFSPPPDFSGGLAGYRSPLQFADGRAAKSAAEWGVRRREILDHWQEALGRWPALIEHPKTEVMRSEGRENFHQHRVRIEVAAEQFEEGWLLIPSGPGPFPAVLVPFYEPETSIGLKGNLRDFARQLTRRGFVTLSIGSPGGDARKPEPGRESWQPLSFLAYVAANCCTALAQRREVDAQRIGIVGHSYGGKWALFAGALDERFACVVVSDPGIVWDEKRSNVNYWEPWYLGRDPKRTRKPGLITAENPRTGAYRELVGTGHDLHEIHALIAPRPFLVSGGAEDPPERWRALHHLVAINRVLGATNRVAMTNRATHDPTPESNEQIYAFFEHFLAPAKP